MPRVSIVVPCHNAAPFIGRTLDSLRNQTLEDWECVVVDDGSSDDSAGVICEYAARDPRIRLLQAINGGVCRARNAGYGACSPDSACLLFLDADDCLEPDMLAVLAGHLDLHPNVSLAYSDFTCIDPDDRPIPPGDPRAFPVAATRYVPRRLGVGTIPVDEPDTPFVSVFSAWAGLLPSCSVLRRSVYADVPGWDEVLGQGGEDTDVFLHMGLRGAIHYVPRPLVRYRRHAAQDSGDRNKAEAQLRRLYAKWAHVQGLTASQQTVVDHARQFREARVLPHLWFMFGASHIKSGHIIEAARCYLRGIRQLARAA